MIHRDKEGTLIEFEDRFERMSADEIFDEVSAPSRAYPTDARALAHDEAIERCASYLEHEARGNKWLLVDMARKLRALKLIPNDSAEKRPYE